MLWVVSARWRCLMGIWGDLLIAGGGDSCAACCACEAFACFECCKELSEG